ncbi:MAG: nitroreductase family deazaflavin-dependent oxidoreductase [Anaerolineae bacterium]
MSEQPFRPSWWRRLNQRIAAVPLAARLFAHVLHSLDRAVIRLSRGRFSLTGLLTGLPVVTLTTIGAKSGMARSVPLIGVPDDEQVILIASNWGQTHHPGWYFNLRAHPEVELSRSGRARKYMAHEAAGPEYDAYWRRAVELYAGYAAYRERTGGRKIPIVVLTPVGE